MAGVGRIYITGEIIPHSWIWDEEDATSAVDVRAQIDRLGTEVDSYEAWIFGPGGFCSEGWAITDILELLEKPLTTIAYGQCASICTIIFTAGETRLITPNCDFMIHLPWGDAWGNKWDIKAYLDELIIESDKIVNRYVAKTGKQTGEEMEEMLKKDFHMTGQMAVDKGFATALLEPDKSVKAMSARNMDRLKNRPPVAMLRKPDNIKLKEEAPKEPENQATNSKPNTQNMATATTNKPEKSAIDIAKEQASLALRFMANIARGKSIKNLDINVEGGQVLEIDVKGDEPAVDDVVTINGAPAPDATYIATADKTEYTVAGGKLTGVKKPEGTEQANDEGGADPTNLAEVLVEVKNLRARVDVLTKSDADKTTALAQANTALTAAQKALGLTVSPAIPVTPPASLKNPTNNGGGAESQASGSALDRRNARAKKKEEAKK